MAQDNKFRRHVDYELGKHAHEGFNGRGEKEAFVCRKALKEYWTRERINEVLNRDADTEANIEAIETTSLETFSILCYVSCSAYFTQFNSRQIIDSALPITQSYYLNSRLSGDARAGFFDALARFAEAQWKFKPLVFDTVIHKKELPPECILPVIFDRSPLTTSSNGESAVYKASVYDCCVGPRLKNNAGVYDVVFKMLGPNESDLWENEVNAYNFLARSSPDQARLSKSLTTMAPSATIASAFNYIPICLGSFIRIIPRPSVYGLHQADSAPPDPLTRDLIDNNRVILLEHARGGNLTTFCKNHAKLVMPSAREDRVNLWHQMFHLLRGLSAVHSTDGTHQDIKESNVLYMYDDGSLRDRDRACFKLADFGKSHFKRNGGTGREGRDINNFGNRIYMAASQKLTYRVVAPECCGADEIEQAHPRPYTQAADIWSMGCLFSDMLVRSSLGQEGVDRYRDARVAENQCTVVREHAPQCFHNGIKRLSCVDEFHREALAKYPDDDVLPAVSHIILQHMLRSPGKRKDALIIRAHWINSIIARDNTSTDATASTCSLVSTAAPSLQPTPAASLRPRTSTNLSRPGPPPPPPSFSRRSTNMQPTPCPAPRPTTAGSVRSVGTSRAAITVRQIAEHLRRPQKLLLRLSRSGIKLETAFPGLMMALNVVGSRNHHFLVDSSETMAKYREEAAETIWVLSKLLKPRVVRRDSVKLSIPTGTNNKVYCLRKSSEFADIVRKSAFSDSESTGWLLGMWLVETATEIMNGLIKSPSPPISLYILTDGEFKGEPPEFATPIQTLLQKLRETQKFMPSFFSITIIRFGDDPAALHELRRLQQSVSNLPDLPPRFNPIQICAWDSDVAEMLTGRIRYSTTNLSLAGMPTRRNTDIPKG